MFNLNAASAGSMQSEAQQIALGLRHGDLVLMDSLVERYQYRLVRYLVYVLGRRDGVDDLVQETWLRVLERGATFDGRSRFEPWLFTIARHLAIDSMRGRRTLSLDASDESGLSEADAVPISAALSPFALAARTEEAALLAESLQALEPVYREALVLRFQEDLSLGEISAVVGAPVSTVASRIYRGLAALRQQLPPRPGFDGQAQSKGASHGC